ncbi:MAG: hypothetical protein H8D23_05030 [Candidatus Brocadiales bacterium]|nr:hypothetical protein [Candidatus Brocadiales bacterium]
MYDFEGYNTEIKRLVEHHDRLDASTTELEKNLRSCSKDYHDLLYNELNKLKKKKLLIKDNLTKLRRERQHHEDTINEDY